MEAKARKQLKNADADMRCALSHSRTNTVLKDKQYFVSH